MRVSRTWCYHGENEVVLSAIATLYHHEAILFFLRWNAGIEYEDAIALAAQLDYPDNIASWQYMSRNIYWSIVRSLTKGSERQQHSGRNSCTSSFGWKDPTALVLGLTSMMSCPRGGHLVRNFHRAVASSSTDDPS